MDDLSLGRDVLIAIAAKVLDRDYRLPSDIAAQNQRVSSIYALGGQKLPKTTVRPVDVSREEASVAALGALRALETYAGLRYSGGNSCIARSMSIPRKRFRYVRDTA